VRCFRVEGSDFFFLVEKLHRTVEQHMHIDSLIGVGAVGRFLRDLKHGAFKADRMILGHGALLLKTQRLLDLI
jgi:hypothetical protein